MSQAIEEAVRSKYGSVATSGLSTEQAGVRAVAEAFGYTPEELASIPAGANMALSCGNPTATARLRTGEVVVDLGCGGGLDVFLAAAKVGPGGKAVGIDMTPEMVDLARQNAAKGNDGRGFDNVEFHQATIDKLPLPTEVGSDLMAYVGCIAGAILIEEYRRQLTEAGFAAVEVIDTRADLNAYAKVEGQVACCSPVASSVEGAGCCPAPAADDRLHRRLSDLLTRFNVNDYAASVRVFAVKP